MDEPSARPVRLNAATPADVPHLLALRDDVARWLIGKGITQWPPG